jgi:hypothetical protein
MAKWICTEKCFHNLILYRIGDPARFKRPQDGPKGKDGKLAHFEKVAEDTPIIEENKSGPKVKVNEKEI